MGGYPGRVSTDMIFTTMRTLAYRSLPALLLLLVPCAHAAAKRALLIGIQSYSTGYKPSAGPRATPGDGAGPSRFEIPKWVDLEGSLNDVDAVKKLLTSSKFAFPSDADHLHILPEMEATREGILAAMRTYLVDKPEPGDQVVFYYAGHGSLRKNSKSIKRANHLDNTIVPIDAGSGTFDVRDREIARIFNAALDKGIRLTAIFDSCNSGTIARGVMLGEEGKTRYLAYDPRDINEPPDMKNGKEVTAPEDRADNPALIFSATQPDQLSHEKWFGDEDHGAFTAALVDALSTLPPDTSAADLYKRVKVVMEGMGLTNQQPMISNSTSRLAEPMFGTGASDGKTLAAILKVNGNSVTLDGGIASNIGPGSELVQVSEAQQKARIRVRSLEGVARSTAEILNPKEAPVSIGDLFEVTKWAPPPASRLAVWTGSANLHYQDIQAAAREFSQLPGLAHVTWVTDPVMQAPTHQISWDGREWVLSQAGSAQKTRLGAKPSAQAVASRFNGAGVKLLVDLPPSTEMAAKWKIGGPTSILEAATSPGAAPYVLVGTVNGSRLQYAWLRRTAMEQGITASAAAGVEAVCSADSSYPLRSDWVPAAGAASLDDAARDLSDLASRLAKVHGWLELPAGLQGSSSFTYHLALKRVSDGVYAGAAPAVDGEEYNLVLKSDRAGPASPRWVYVFTISCNGQGTLLFPITGGENRFPNEDGKPDEIPLTLGRYKLGIQAPFGLDTYVLLTTADQLPDPGVLNFEGAATRGGGSALEDLLRSTSSGTRAASVPITADWGVQYLQVRSVPKPPEKE
jgi:hypothetical protein